MVDKANLEASKSFENNSADETKMNKLKGNEDDIWERIKFLDVELQLSNGEENNIDEDPFCSSAKRREYIQKAFERTTLKKTEEVEKWGKHFRSILEEEGEIGKDFSNDLFALVGFDATKLKDGFIKKDFRYSLNMVCEDKLDYSWDRDFSMTYFTKFLIALNLIFRISFIYKKTEEVSYHTSFATVYKIIVLQFFDFDNSSTLFSVNNISNQIAFFAFVLVWIFTFIILICMIKSGQIIQITENSSVQYNTPVYSQKKALVFHINLVLFMYLFIPVVRDSIMTIFFIVENVNSSGNFKIFFQTDDSRNIILWIKFLLCALICISFFIVPIYLYFVLKSNSPIINPFDENGDTVFHSVGCPKKCDGALLDIDRRMCWDNTKDNLFIADLKRPISKLFYNEKKLFALRKYFKDSQMIPSYLMIFFKGYSYYSKFNIISFLLMNYLFIFFIKIPFSTLFTNFVENDFSKRTLISYSLSSFFCLFIIIWDVIHFKTTFNYQHDAVLNLINDCLILIINIVQVLKVTILGEYIFAILKNVIEKNSTLVLFEEIVFGCVMACFVVLLAFIIYSIPWLREKIIQRRLIFPLELLDERINEKDLQSAIIDYLWKPFWDNLFRNDSILSEGININEVFCSKYLGGQAYLKNFIENDLSLSPLNRLKSFKKKLILTTNEDQEENANEKKTSSSTTSAISEHITNAEILIRKYIQFNLEGIDVYWDGNVIGKRTCTSYFGRLFVHDYPFQLLMIYDETNEKVFIPKDEWISLCKVNLQDSEVKRKVKVRESLRLLNNKTVAYNESFYEDKKCADMLEEQMNVKKVTTNAFTRRKTLVRQLTDKHAEGGKKFSPIEEVKWKIGVLKVQSIVPDNIFKHGFNITLEVQNPKNPKKITEVIKFDSKELAFGSKDFQFSKINILLQMNRSTLSKCDPEEIPQLKNDNRDGVCCRRYLKEITLSSLFYDLIYNNQNCTILDVFKYFAKYEKRREMKMFIYNHILEIIKVFYLWELTLMNPIQTLWYLFFYQVWHKNKKMISDLRLSSYFDPDDPRAICFYYLDKNSLKKFFQKCELLNAVPKNIVEKLYKKIEQLKQNELNKIKLHVQQLRENGISERELLEMMMKKKNKKLVPNKEEEEGKHSGIDEEIIEIFLRKDKSIKDKFFEVLDHSPILTATPSWVYLSYNNERMMENKRQQYESIIDEYFINKSLNPEELFQQIGNDAKIISVYFPNEIFTLFQQRDLRVKNGKLANYLLQKRYQPKDSSLDETSSITSDIQQIGKKKKNFDIGKLELYLPSIYQLIDKKFHHFDKNYLQKIDLNGRIFYVNQDYTKTQLHPPELKIKEKIKVDKDSKLESIEQIEAVYYKIPNQNAVRMLYLDHIEKTTSWIDPTKRKKRTQDED